MNAQLPKIPVQLIAFDKDKNPYITEEALNVLSQLQSNSIHVIAVAGKYRTGKSYILNRVLLDRSNGFNVGHTINACTKGLWMWPELIKLGDKDCLIIDTEGLGSLEEGQSTDLKIFMLALLFSSYLIYNSTGNIDQQALESLNLVIQLANVLQRQDRYDSQELVNTFPSFLWLLRDFSLKLVNDKGDPLTPTQYLEQALKHQPKTTPAAERKNQIRKQLRTFFQHRDCFSLVRPTEQERDLQNLSSLPANRLRPQFLKLIKDLKLHISSQVKPKRVRGRVLSIEGFVEMCKFYTKALVDGKLPTITSHWDNLCLGETHRIFQKYQLEHIKTIEQSKEEMSEIQKKHNLIIKAGLQAIDKSFLGKLQKQLFKERFQRKLEGQFQQFKIKINNKRNNEIKALLDSLEDIQNDQATIIDKYQRMMEKMSELSQTSVKDDGLYCELFLYLSQHSRSLLQESEAKRFEFQASMNEKMTYFEDLVAHLKTVQTKTEERHLEELNALRNQSRLSLGNIQEIRQRQKQNLHKIFALQRQTKDLAEMHRNIALDKQAIAKALKERESQLMNKDEQIKDLHQKLQVMDIELAKKQELIKEDTIKLRKLFRQKSIVKNRYEEYLDENILLRNTIDSMQGKIMEAQKRNLSKDSDTLEKQYFSVKSLALRYENEIRMLNNRLQDFQSTFQTIIGTPQHQKYFTLKHNYEMEVKQKYFLQEKHFQARFALSNCEKYTCLLCKRDISGQIILFHSKICGGLEEGVKFDVSYRWEEGNLQFLIDVNNHQRVCSIIKTEKEVSDLLSQLGYQYGFQPILDKNLSKIDFSVENQQKRVFIQNILQGLDKTSLLNPYFMQFLEFDPRKHQKWLTLTEDTNNQITFQ